MTHERTCCTSLERTNLVFGNLCRRTQCGPIVDNFKKIVEDMFKGACTAKGALIITPEKVIVTTPGPDNKKVL